MSIGYGPKLITDGLVLCLDAADSLSYPGSGTTWTDLSGQGNNGTINGATYDSSYGGTMVFDSNNERVEITGTGLSYTSFSIDSFIKPSNNDGEYNAIISTTLGTNNDYEYGLNWDLGPDATSNFSVMNLEISRAYGGFYNRDIMTSSIPFGVWTYVALVVDSVNDNYKIYVNGVEDYTASYSGTITYFDRITIGQRFYGSVYQGGSTFNGNISSVKIYNRALTAAEIQQNFNALRGRFGI
jgi:hypothetical protein